MAQLMEYAEYLSKEIGPRPAGTEEEQQAALYITECFQKDSGFSAQIEEFTSSSNVESMGALPGLVVIVVAILSMLFPVLSVPAFVLAAASAALYTLEAFGHPIVTRALARGASQNVVAKYQPGSEPKPSRGRSRKIVLVARYDSEKVTPAFVRTVESLKLPAPIGLVCVCGIVLAAFFLLLHIFINFGIGGLVVNVLTIISLIICAYPVIRTILFRAAPYNEGANNNASGTAALLEVARRISRGSVSEADLAGDPEAYGLSIHGEQAARESGLVPEGAQILYEAEQLVPPSELGEYDAEERLLAAKAAIAAMTGQPVERRIFGSVATNLVNSRAQGDDPVFESAPAQIAEQVTDQAISPVEDAREEQPPAAIAQAEQPRESEEPFYQAVAVEEPVVDDDFENAPSWFVSARQNAKKPAGDTGPVMRSRYTEAIEAAEREAAEREREAAERNRLQQEAELKERLQREAELKREQQAAVESALETQEAQTAQSEPELEEEPPSIQAPVFVPYAEAVAKGEPTDDEFAASLGDTTAFDPHMIQEAETKGRLADLPTFEDSAPAPAVEETTSPSRSGMFRKLRVDVPSMSGVIRMQQAGEDVSQLPVQQAGGDFAPLPMQKPITVGSYDADPLEAPFDEDEFVEYEEDVEDDAWDGRKWEGGAFSRVRLGRVDTRSGEDAEADMPSEPIEEEEDRQIADEIEQIYHFRNPLYNTEVWFVALGSEGFGHDGVRAFLAEHEDDLRGAMVIEVESLGVGELCTASVEGRVRQITTSSRIKRYIRSATAATGIAPGSVDLTGSDSAASIIQAAGYQAMHLLGVEDGKPALKGSPDDILENIDDLLLDDNVNFLMELLKK